jgi:hypothetical protein
MKETVEGDLELVKAFSEFSNLFREEKGTGMLLHAY